MVDHKIPHRGDQALVWDRANWQSFVPQPQAVPVRERYFVEHITAALERGAKEQETYVKAIVMTGNASGMTCSYLL
ncbi:MAG: hypothetical protein RSB86_19005 [Comamonas sp.]|uniref:hypothetical protein n=1 Tax=Comamonas sp. TaxID=34028 RepID=UPI002FC78621